MPFLAALSMSALTVGAFLGLPSRAEEEPVAPDPPVVPAKEPSLPRLAGAVFVSVNAHGAEEWYRTRDGATIVRVPGGPFLRRPYEGWQGEEDPVPVEVASFYVDKFEVTNERFARFLNSLSSPDELRGLIDPSVAGLVRSEDGWKAAAGLETYPVTAATGLGAERFAAWAGGRLPKAAEWEKAASGEKGFLYPWGNELPDSTRANFAVPRGTGAAQVGSRPRGASPYGCLDMAGNVYERVLSRRYGGMKSPVVIKGGSWVSASPLNLRALDMCVQPMNVAERSVGFRLVMDDPEPTRTSLKRASSAGSAPPKLRLARDWKSARAEATKRRVPLLIGLFHETCGQSDRTREQCFQDPRFVAYCNEHAVVVVGHIPSDAEDLVHKPGKDGACPLWDGLTCREHVDLYTRAVGVVRNFSSSPGNFVLHPDRATKGARAKAVLIGEGALPKWGNAVRAYIRGLEKAKAAIDAQDAASTPPPGDK